MSYYTRDNPYPLLYVIRKSIFGLWLAALLWYTVRCVAADHKPRMEIVVPLMLLPWVLATWGEV